MKVHKRCFDIIEGNEINISRCQHPYALISENTISIFL
ncbi:hypothetical protein [Azospirillum endophyticum]